MARVRLGRLERKAKRERLLQRKSKAYAARVHTDTVLDKATLKMLSGEGRLNPLDIASMQAKSHYKGCQGARASNLAKFSNADGSYQVTSIFRGLGKTAKKALRKNSKGVTQRFSMSVQGVNDTFKKSVKANTDSLRDVREKVIPAHWVPARVDPKTGKEVPGFMAPPRKILIGTVVGSK